MVYINEGNDKNKMHPRQQMRVKHDDACFNFRLILPCKQEGNRVEMAFIFYYFIMLIRLFQSTFALFYSWADPYHFIKKNILPTHFSKKACRAHDMPLEE